MKNIIITIIAIIVIILGLGWYLGWFDSEPTKGPGGFPVQQDRNGAPDAQQAGDSQKAEDQEPAEIASQTIGASVGGYDITAYHYPPVVEEEGGKQEILFVGGIHGGYSWNTTLLAFELMDYLQENPDVIPDNVTVTVIPVLNPDGLERVAGTATERFSPADVSGNTVAGRFNGNSVDLNRNFNCNWESAATWRDNPVDPGDAAFSEPEAQALRDYVIEHNPAAAVVWYSAAGGVYTSSCNGNLVMPETEALMNTYADASGYPAKGRFDAYAVTGDAVDWMAKQGIPAASVLLDTHDQVEWNKNRKGIEAVLNAHAE